MKKIISILLILLLSFNFVFASPNLNIYSPAAILIDANTGRILYEKNSNQKMYPASTTKTLTALITLEHINDLSKEITISKHAVNSVPSGSSIAGYRAGEIVTIEQILNTLLICSANDGANILAEQVSGSTEDFAILMNQTAKRLGANNSNFVNAHGFHDPNHFSTAYDLAIIAKHAMKNAKFREIVSKTDYTIEPTNKVDEPRYFLNTNRLLRKGDYHMPEVKGIKTGYTSQAGNCLISFASKNGVDIISVVLGGKVLPNSKSEVYEDSTTLLKYGLQSYSNQTILSEGTIIQEITPKKSGNKSLQLLSQNNINALIENGSTPNFETIIEVDENIEAPIEEGQILGKITYKSKDIIIGESNLVAASNLKKQNIFLLILSWILGIILLFIALVILLIFFNYFRIKYYYYKKRKNRNKENKERF